MRTIIVLLAFIVPIIPLKAQWVQQNIPTGIGMVVSMDFKNNQNGCLGGWVDQGIFRGRTLYKINSGTSWNFGSVPDSVRTVVNIQYINSGMYYASGAFNENSFEFSLSSSNLRQERFMKELDAMGYNRGGNTRGCFLRTTDNGMTWNTYGVIPDIITFIYSMEFLDSTVGYMVAEDRFDRPNILKTNNGGLSWDIVYQRVDRWMRDIDFINTFTGFAAGGKFFNGVYSGIILKTTNGGNSWTEQELNYFENLLDVSFSNSNTGYVMGNDTNLHHNHIYKTTNSGNSWYDVGLNIGILGDATMKFIPTTGIGITMGEDFNQFPQQRCLVYKTIDYGVTWQKDSILYNSVLFSSKLFNANNWFVGGGSFLQGVLYHTTTGGSVFIEPIGSEVPSSYSLEQNYPNPFNPSTRIRFSIPVPSETSLKVYDIMGREVAKLVDQKLSAGNYEVEFSGENLNTGIYFYRFASAGKNFVKKMILVK